MLSIPDVQPDFRQVAARYFHQDLMCRAAQAKANGFWDVYKCVSVMTFCVAAFL